VWPGDRDALARALERIRRPSGADGTKSGRAVAVFGARGGAGVTFLATNLAAAFAARGATCVLADLDPFYTDVSVALGVSPNGGAPTIADLAPVLDELTVEHVERVLYRHPRGFHTLLAPAVPGAVRLSPDHVGAVARTLRAAADVAILHLPRSLDDTTVAAMEAADDVLLVVTLDVVAFRDARRTLERLEAAGVDGRCKLVINRATRAEVAPDDAEHVFGIRPVSVIRADRSVGRAQNRGEVLAGRSGAAARRVAALAERLLDHAAAEGGSA
ncbi:MAG TPA: hypothetical protein VG709_01895, partial [Actinomycetota bacterium]|nr:hypothetical protein [Actinomycetota bacterium]